MTTSEAQGNALDIHEFSAQEIIERLQGNLGNSDVLFREISFRYFNHIVGFLMHHYHMTHEEAEDIAQESLVKIFTNLHGIDAKRFEQWIYSVARHCAIDHFRMQSRRITYVTDESEDMVWSEGVSNEGNPIHTLLLRERAELLTEAIGKLPEKERALVESHYRGGHSVQELAGQLGEEVWSIKHHLHEARIKLADALRRSHCFHEE